MDPSEWGGSAFPKYFGGNRDLAPGEEPGMTLRDWFAGQVLPGVVHARTIEGLDMTQESIAQECYEIADAMLTERAK